MPVRRLAAATLLLAVTAVPLLAQGGRMGRDPTNAVAGSGQLPAGWMMRFDPVPASRPQPKPTDVKFVTMGTGYHVTSGPAAIYYNPKDVGSGSFAVSATFTQAHSSAHESYGIFIGGTHLQDSLENYLYLVVRPLDGNFVVKHRMTDARPSGQMAPSPAINKDDPTDGHATNTLTIHVAKDTVHFIINGKLVQAMAKADLGMSTDGIVGLRINHNLDVHIDKFGITK